jgi:hypothetical protein
MAKKKNVRKKKVTAIDPAIDRGVSVDIRKANNGYVISVYGVGPQGKTYIAKTKTERDRMLKKILKV